MNKDTIFLTTGEFAKLCDTTKDTLFHYDAEGVLRPAKVGNNGYRYYHVNQFYEYDLIFVLRDAGSSLAEIRTYLQHSTPQARVAFLQQQAEVLRQRQQTLARQEHLLRTSALRTQHAFDVTLNQPQLIEKKVAYLITQPYTAEDTDANCVECLSRLFAHCARHNYIETLSTGSIIYATAIADKTYRDGAYYCQVQVPAEDSLLVTRPAGTYAQIYHKGEYASLPLAYETLFSFLRANNLQPNGPLYTEDAAGYISVNNPSEIITEVFIPVASCP